MQLFAPNTYGVVQIEFDSGSIDDGGVTKITIPDIGTYELYTGDISYIIIFRYARDMTTFGLLHDNSGDAVMVNVRASNAIILLYEQSSSTPLPYSLWSSTFKE